MKLLDNIIGKVRYNAVVEWYNFLYLLLGKKEKITPTISSIDETVEKIVKSGASVSRFGDGEILLIGGKPIRFQKRDEKLGRELKQVLESDQPNHLVTLSDTFRELYRYNRRARRFWRSHFYLYGTIWQNSLKSEKIYYNTFLTRPYMDFKDKSLATNWFKALKTIWEGRDIVLIEGEKSRLGFGNDLFDNAASIGRVLGPSKDAYSRIDEIEEFIATLGGNYLYLIALGPTATVLASRLYKRGLQAIDVGHVDIEYEWYRMGAKRKIPVPSKFVNESLKGDTDSILRDEKYQSQIIKTFL